MLMILKTATKVIKKVETMLFHDEKIAESPKFAPEMKIKYVILAFAASLLSASCKTAEDATEDAASTMLDEARQLLADKHYAAARDTIFSLRRQHPTALDVRRAAILTLDSVELMETRDSLHHFEDSLNAVREHFKTMLPRLNGHTNEDYYIQQRRIFEMQNHFDELCAKAKFYIRKIDIDAQEER